MQIKWANWIPQREASGIQFSNQAHRDSCKFVKGLRKKKKGVVIYNKTRSVRMHINHTEWYPYFMCISTCHVCFIKQTKRIAVSCDSASNQKPGIGGLRAMPREWFCCCWWWLTRYRIVKVQMSFPIEPLPGCPNQQFLVLLQLPC